MITESREAWVIYNPTPYISNCFCKWIYEKSYIWTAEKDMKTWLIIAVIHTTSSVGRALHRYRRGHHFFQALISLSWWKLAEISCFKINFWATSQSGTRNAYAFLPFLGYLNRRCLGITEECPESIPKYESSFCGGYGHVWKQTPISKLHLADTDVTYITELASEAWMQFKRKSCYYNWRNY